MRWGMAVCVLLTWAGAVRGDSKKLIPWPFFPAQSPEGIQFTDGRYRGKSELLKIGVYDVDSDTVIFHKENWAVGSTEERVSKKHIRYLVYTHYVIPFLDGVAQEQIGLFRETEYPNSGAILFGIVGFGVGVWQGMESLDSDKSYNFWSSLNTSFARGRTSFYQERRDRQRVIAGVSLLGGVVFTIVATTPKTTLKLPDGTIIGLTSTPNRMGMQLAYTW